MRERPIIFSAPMIRAILRGEKTQTRRVVKFRDVPEDPDCHGIWRAWNGRGHDWQDGDEVIRCPYGEPGDQLWVRETWYCDHLDAQTTIPKAPPEHFNRDMLYYRERDGNPSNNVCYTGFAGETMVVPWRPSIHMPRWASRLQLRVVMVRPERLQWVGDVQAMAEGIGSSGTAGVDFDVDGEWWPGRPLQRFIELWDGLNAKRGYGWKTNPWVWAITFDPIAAAP